MLRLRLLAAMDAACEDITAESWRVDSPLKEILSLLHCKRWYSLWCRWKYVARQTGTSGCARMIYSNVYVVCSIPIFTTILFTVVHSSTQREFMFVVNKCVFFLLHNAVNKLELQRAYAIKMWNIHIQCLVLSYLTKYNNV